MISEHKAKKTGGVAKLQRVWSRWAGLFAAADCRLRQSLHPIGP